MGFEQAEKDNMYKLTAANMHMGEMKFKQRPREEQAEIEATDGQGVQTFFIVRVLKASLCFQRPNWLASCMVSPSKNLSRLS